ncbi:MAG: amino acid permease [Candidatus Calescibacterium sp.]|nr:amino acid permease [Candidatus Calescibacterium sp.]MDW8132627.1 amino acid permease [Candidatus Calescibacterium sp.]
MNLFRTKRVEEFLKDLEEGPQLKRALGPIALISLGLGAIIGAGIFVITGHAAASYAGPAVAISFIISGIACALAGLAYAEFAAMVPVAGSAYTYSYATLGEFWAWFIAWNLVLEYLIAGATVAVGWSGYVVDLLKQFGIHISPVLTNAPLDILSSEEKRKIIESGKDLSFIEKYLGLHFTGSYINLPAVLIVFVVGLILLIGISESAIVNNIIVILKTFVLLLFVVIGFGNIDVANWDPFIPPSSGNFGEYGWSGVLRAAGVVFFAYIGFDAVSTAAQEAKNPQRDVPIGILGSLFIATLLYIAVSLVLTGVVHYSKLHVPAPIAVAVNAMGPQFGWLMLVVKLGAIAGLTSVILMTLLGQTRIFFAMARDGLLPESFSKIHSRFKTPYISTIVVTVAAMFIAAIFPINILGELVSIGTLLAFSIVCVAVAVLRIKRPELNRPFKMPLVFVLAPLGALACVLQMVFLPLDTWFRLAIWTIIGVSIYFLYGYKHSRLAKKE